MTEPTPLDRAHARMEASDAGRLAFFAALADAELFLLLEREAEGEAVAPRLFPVEGGEVALAFDTEERLAEFVGGTAAYAALPGRVLADLLAGRDLGLGLNLDVAPSSLLLPPEALRWLERTFGAHGPGLANDRIASVRPPEALPEALLDALAGRLVQASGLAERALLARVQYAGGGEGHLLAVVDADPRAEAALARAVNEALAFSGADTGSLDVAFFEAAHPAVARLDRVAMRFDIPAPQRPVPPAAPGSDPSRPPKLR